ncbi:DUF805 domain-containing protein [Woodsholea maritima]|uniref:DUF805 domain-containing protein n=1 Tax=Woodsholea maritima TaxID=240237 RepID=UPI0003635CA9|nr:DUF805 domain-containing protein [Woodsholea maritima]
MGFVDAVKSVLLQNYANFQGRARRSEYWFFALFYFLVYMGLSILAAVLGKAGGIISILMGLFMLGVLIPNIAVGVRRLHDTSRSGWWLLISLVPIIGAIWLIVLLVQDSHGDNQYGPNPKGGEGSAPIAPAAV